MEKITRSLLVPLRDRLLQNDKIVLLFGPRQVGKTTLVRDVLVGVPGKILWINGDEEKYNATFASRDLATMWRLVGGYDTLIIDEAQRIENIGLGLKILRDAHPELRIIATGSSSLDLASKMREPLTGRTATFHLYPLSFQELSAGRSPGELDGLINEVLVYGLYPGVFLEKGAHKAQLLSELATSYLYRDVLEFEGIRHPRKIRDLLRLLAFQIGQEVSIHEISNALDLNANTVLRYIDLLEKSFVIYRLSAYARNLRKEVSKKDKIYFWDVGVRNAVIDHLKELSARDDVGRLWENFLVTERIKKTSYAGARPGRYFWRVYTGDEIDYIEDDGVLSAWEFKYSKTSARPPKGFLETYPGSRFSVVSRQNYLDFIT